MINQYAHEIAVAVDATLVDAAADWLIDHLANVHLAGNRVYLVGNGGSAAIASHIAIDLSKNAGIRALALNDASALTCTANDFGYELVFAEQLRQQADKNDVLIAISSSGSSINIIEAAAVAKELGMTVITFSGNVPSSRPNKLSVASNVNIDFYTPSNKYGVVENAHQIILHYIVDRLCERRSQTGS